MNGFLANIPALPSKVVSSSALSGHYFSLRDFSIWDGQKEEQNEDEIGKKKELCKGVIIS